MPNPIIHASFRLTVPVGVQLVQWPTHGELRFLRKDARTVLAWLQAVASEFADQVEDLSQEFVVSPCTDCDGKGQKPDQSGQLKVCMACSGSGRRGFKVPGKRGSNETTSDGRKTEPAPSIADEPGPNKLFTRDQLDRALKSCSTDGAPIELEKLMAAIEKGAISD